jgi:hypothetical protein
MFATAQDITGPRSEPGDVSAETPATPPPPDPESLSDEDLEAALCTHAAHIAAAECRFVLMVAEVDRRGIWANHGARTCAHWLSWRCGLSVGVGREHVRVGRALAGLPSVRRAFARGELSYSKVRAITRVATPAMEESLLDMAAYATASQLETIVAAFRRAAPDEGVAALQRHRGRYLHSYTDEEGMVVIKARLSPEDAATVLAAVERARQDLREDGDPGVSAETPSTDPKNAYEPFAASCADALVAVCEAHEPSARRRAFASGPRASVVVHVDRQVLGDAGAEGCAHIEGIGVVSAHTVQRLVCDAAVSTLAFDSEGTAIPEGHTRQIPDSLRRAVLTRDGGCRWPGCNRRRYVDVHHVVFVSHGGRTRLTNLATLCRAHHRLVHEGGYRLDMDARATISVKTPKGVPIPARTTLPGGEGIDLVALQENEGLRCDEHTMPIGGERYDLDLTIDVLMAAARRRDRQPVAESEGAGASPSER